MSTSLGRDGKRRGSIKSCRLDKWASKLTSLLILAQSYVFVFATVVEQKSRRPKRYAFPLPASVEIPYSISKSEEVLTQALLSHPAADLMSNRLP